MQQFCQQLLLVALLTMSLALHLTVVGSLCAQRVPQVRALPMQGWPQWGGTSHRNNVSMATNIPAHFDVESGVNLRWKAALGSATYNSPVVLGGKVFIGTNNDGNRIARLVGVDRATMLCFSELDGSFLWQYSNPRNPAGRAVDWPSFGGCSMPLADGDRIWFVNSRAEVVCLDANGFLDEKNDGRIQNEESDVKDEADIIWTYDMVSELGVHPHNLVTTSVTAAGELLLLNTGNGVGPDHITLPAPDAPSFVAIDRDTGKLVWSDASPRKNIVHGQWSAPAYGVFDGVPQAIFAGGDGWLYSFDWRGIRKGRSELLWKYDCNPKKSVWKLGGLGDRNNLMATPMIWRDRIYIGTGQDVEHGGHGPAVLHCIDPTKRGDISPQLVFDDDAPDKPIEFKLPQACVEADGNFVRDNPNSGANWQFTAHDLDANGRIEAGEQMTRTTSTVVADDGLVYVTSLDGYVRCLDADTGELYWSYDTMATITGSPMICDGKLIVGTDDGIMLFLKCGKELNLVSEVEIDNSVYGTPTAVGETLYIATSKELLAVGKSE